MREIRQSGSEGGGDSVSPYPYHGFDFTNFMNTHVKTTRIEDDRRTALSTS
jgi:hypothetical protein